LPETQLNFPLTTPPGNGFAAIISIVSQPCLKELRNVCLVDVSPWLECDEAHIVGKIAGMMLVFLGSDYSICAEW
jgi:hypothetical protein